MGGRLGLCKGFLWLWFSKQRVAGLLWCNFPWVVIGCDLGSRHGGFLGEFGMDPI